MIASAAVHASAAPPPLVFVVPGGDLAGLGDLPGAPGPVPADLAGWSVRGGASSAQPVNLPQGGTAVRLAGNASLVTPVFAVDARAQTVSVTIGSGAGAVVDVVAEFPDGGAPVLLDTVEAPTALAAVPVPVSAVRGRTVRLVLDPTAALGATLEVASVGPVTAPLAGWSVAAGVPQALGAGASRVLQVRDEPLQATSPAFAPGADARFVLAAVRGDGALRLTAGGRTARVVADGTWRDVRLAVAGLRRVAGVTLRADPDGGRMEVRDLGVVVRQVRVPRPVARRQGRRVTVAGALGVAGARLPVRLRDRGRSVATVRADGSGRFRVRYTVRPGRPRVVLEVVGDRTRLGGVRTLTLR